MKRFDVGSRAAPLIITRIQFALRSRQAHTHQNFGLLSARSLSQSVSKAAPPPSSSSSSSSQSHAQPPPPPPPPRPQQDASPHDASDTAHQEARANETPPTENISRASSWFWRTVYLSAGVGTAALTVQYANDTAKLQADTQALYDEMKANIRYFTEPSREKLLPDLPVPYPNAPTVRTLIINLENTLVHSTYSRATGWRVAKRPGTEAFLAYMASFYEIVVFTSNMITYADPILDRLDPNQYISQRLYRAETHYKNGVHIKDLSNMNRELSRTLVIDHDERHVSMQPENAIIIPKWTGDTSDTALLDLIPLLEGVVREDFPDVREVASILRDKPIAVGVAEYRAMAAGRAERARSASMFGHVAPAEEVSSRQPVAQELGGREGEGKDEASKGGVWNALPGRSKLFQTKSGGPPPSDK